VLINITGGLDLTLFEVDEAANRIRDEVDPEAKIIFGSSLDESLSGRMRVSVVATGIDAAAMVEPKPTVVSLMHNRPPRPAAPAMTVARTAEATARKIEPTLAAPSPAPVAVAPAPSLAEVLAPIVAPESVIAAAPAPLIAEAQPVAPAVAMPAAKFEPVAKPEPIAKAEPAKRIEPSFIAPRPIEPALPPRIANPAAARPANVFAEADMVNAPALPAREPRRRGPSLFERVTGTGRARAGETAPQPAAAAPAAMPAPAPVAAATAPAPAAAPAPVPVAAAVPAPTAVSPVQQRLGGLDPSDRLTTSRAEDDLLDIPAFLRRQAN
jgi:cell division protein FtsZ